MNIDELPGLGPVSKAMLAQAGITSIDQLQRVGSVDAYLQVKKVCSGASLNLLWAMEGALTQRSWRDVAKKERFHLITALEQASNQPIF